MKHFVLYLIAAATAILGLSACTDQDMVDYKTYPAHEQLGNWQSYSTNDESLAFNVGLSLNAEGDTVCHVSIIDVESGMASAHVTTNCVYDPQCGMTTANFDNSAFGRPMRVYMSRLHNGEMQVQVCLVLATASGESLSRIVYGNADATKGFRIDGSEWVSTDEQVYFYFDNESNKCLYRLGADEQIATYAFDFTTGEGTVTLDDGSVITLGVNSNNQLVATIGGVAYTLQRVI